MLKKPARVPGLSRTRKFSLSGVSAYFPLRFASNSRPTNAFMIARNPRVEAPVSRLTSSTDFGPRARVSKTLFDTAAPMIKGGA